LFDNIITIGFLAVVPRCFAWKDRSWVERFRIFVNVFVEPPLKATWAFPKFDGIVLTFVEE